MARVGKGSEQPGTVDIHYVYYHSLAAPKLARNTGDSDFAKLIDKEAQVLLNEDFHCSPLYVVIFCFKKS